MVLSAFAVQSVRKLVLIGLIQAAEAAMEREDQLMLMFLQHWVCCYNSANRCSYALAMPSPV